MPPPPPCLPALPAGPGQRPEPVAARARAAPLATGLDETAADLAPTLLDDQHPELPEHDPEHRQYPDCIEVGVDADGRAVEVELASSAV